MFWSGCWQTMEAPIGSAGGTFLAIQVRVMIQVHPAPVRGAKPTQNGAQCAQCQPRHHGRKKDSVETNGATPRQGGSPSIWGVFFFFFFLFTLFFAWRVCAGYEQQRR